MITSRIQIGSGAVQDTNEAFGFIYKSGDRRFAAPEKKRDASSYPEEAGVHEDPRTVDDKFDYSVEFIILAPNKDLENANAKICAFNSQIREKITDSAVKRCKTVTFYDDYKRCKIVGIPEVIESVDEKNYYRRRKGGTLDCVIAKLTIHVTNPTLCDFDLQQETSITTP